MMRLGLISAAFLALPTSAFAQFIGPDDRVAPRAYRSPGYEQGAVGRSYADKLSDIISAKDFGVKCDGSTDDTTAIVEALTAANAKNLLFPAGPSSNCVVSSQITISLTGGVGGAPDVPASITAYGVFLEPKTTIAGPILFIEKPENVVGRFTLAGLGLNCNASNAQYGLKIHGSQYNTYRDINVTGTCSVNAMWLSGEPSFGIYYNNFNNVHLAGATGACLQAKSINNAGNYYIASNPILGIQMIGCGTYGADLDYFSGGLFDPDFENNTTAGLNIDHSIQVNLFSPHFENNNAGATAVTTPGTNTNGLTICGGRTIGTIAVALLANNSNFFCTTDNSGNESLYGPQGVRGIASGFYTSGEIIGVGSASTLALNANTLYAWPLIFDYPQTWTTIAVNVTNTGTATQCRLGIFNAGGNGTGSPDGYPNTLIVDAGTVSVSGMGVASATINQFLPTGLSYGVIVCNGTVTVTSIGAIASIGSSKYNAAIGVTAFATSDIQLSKAFTFGVLSGASPFGAVTRAAANLPVIALKH